MHGQNFVHTSSLDFQVISCNDGLVTLQMQVPEQFLSTIPTLFSSLQDTARLISFKSKVAAANVRSQSPELVARQQESKKRHDETILHRFDLFRQKLPTDREAIRATRDFFQARDMYVTSYTIELIARSHGRLRKSNKTKA